MSFWRGKRVAEGDCPDGYGETDDECLEGVVFTGLRLEELVGCHQQAGEPAETIEESDHLGHGGHLHLFGGDYPDDGPDRDAYGDPFVIEPLIDQRGGNREEHADGRQLVSFAGGVGRPEQADAEDEEDGRADVGEVDPNGAAGSPCVREKRGKRKVHPFLSPFFLNISSMRSVTTYPPATLMEASTRAAKPIQ